MTMNNHEIKLLIFSSLIDRHFTQALSATYELLNKGRIIQCSSIADLSIALNSVLFGFGIIVVFVRDKKELNKICQIKDRLKGHSVILILDSELDDLNQKYLQLYPRYTSYIKDDYTDIFLVLEKMTTHIHSKFKGVQNG